MTKIINAYGIAAIVSPQRAAKMIRDDGARLADGEKLDGVLDLKQQAETEEELAKTKAKLAKLEAAVGASEKEEEKKPKKEEPKVEKEEKKEEPKKEEKA